MTVQPIESNEGWVVQIDKRFLITALAVIAGCANSTETKRATSELDVNRQRWADQKLSRYEFTFNRTCFCVPLTPVRISVRDGIVIGVTEIASGRSLPAAGFLTVDSLFALIDHGIANHYAEMRVTYDSALGYPKQIYSDGSMQIADDEITYTVKDLVSVK